METSFFSGSENLYKYLVTIGILIMVLTVYYPLKQKQELEIIKIQLQKELECLNFKIKENNKNVTKLRSLIVKNGTTRDNKKSLIDLDKLNFENNISQIEMENKYDEILVRSCHISLYNYLTWIFFPIGVIICIYGFCKWNTYKKVEDSLQKLEKEKLEIEVNILKQDNNVNNI